LGAGEEAGNVSEKTFVIDIGRCTGCETCAVACKDRAGIADELDWIRVEEHETGECPRTSLFYRVRHCFHCADPPCAEVCPTQAITKNGNGLVDLDAEKCVSCGKCVEACPFDAIAMPEGDGVASKCDACADEVAMGWDPTCVRACPTRALRYTAKPQGRSENRVEDSLFEDQGIGPAVLYLRRQEKVPARTE
jgi:anaerobic dimethyl sulfoxide reductase subunit B (iron-sulfur subunit)